MSQDFHAAEERALLAAADLAAAANDVITRYTIRWEDARDDVDFAVLSRRWTSYATPSRQLDAARNDLDFASRARTEIGRISESLRVSAAERGEDVVAAETAFIGRLGVLAAECERRASSLRT